MQKRGQAFRAFLFFPLGQKWQHEEPQGGVEMEKKGHSTYIIGDIHGMYDALRVLIRRLDNPALDKFVFLGDYIDHGPSSKEVLDLVISLGDKAICLMGNHEQLLLDTLLNEKFKARFGHRAWLDNGGQSTIDSFGYENFEEFSANLDQKYIDFLMNLKCFHQETIVSDYGKALKFLITHAGVMPDIALDEQLAVNNYHDLNRFIEEKDVWIEDAFTWVRRDFLKAEPSHWSPYIVIHGHTPTHLLEYDVQDFNTKNFKEQLYVRKDPEKDCPVSINIDTGVAFGRRLTALQLSPKALVDRATLRAGIWQVDLEKGYYRSHYLKYNSFGIGFWCGTSKKPKPLLMRS